MSEVSALGWITYPERGKREDLTVMFNDDGGITIEWEEPSDDHYGRSMRRVSFSEDEFDELVRERAAWLARVPPSG